MSLLEAPRERWRTPLRIAAIVTPLVAATVAVARALREPTTATLSERLVEQLGAHTGLDLRAIVRLGRDTFTAHDPRMHDVTALETLRAGAAETQRALDAWVEARLTERPAFVEPARFRWLLAVEQLCEPALREIAHAIADQRLLEARLAMRPDVTSAEAPGALTREVNDGLAHVRALRALRRSLAEKPTSLPHEATDLWRARVDALIAPRERTDDETSATDRVLQRDALRREGEDLRAVLDFYGARARANADAAAAREHECARRYDEAARERTAEEATRVRAEARAAIADAVSERGRERALEDAHRACVAALDEGLTRLETAAIGPRKRSWW